MEPPPHNALQFVKALNMEIGSIVVSSPEAEVEFGKENLSKLLDSLSHCISRYFTGEELSDYFAQHFGKERGECEELARRLLGCECDCKYATSYREYANKCSLKRNGVSSESVKLPPDEVINHVASILTGFGIAYNGAMKFESGADVVSKSVVYSIQQNLTINEAVKYVAASNRAQKKNEIREIVCKLIKVDENRGKAYQEYASKLRIGSSSLVPPTVLSQEVGMASVASMKPTILSLFRCKMANQELLINATLNKLMVSQEKMAANLQSLVTAEVTKAKEAVIKKNADVLLGLIKEELSPELETKIEDQCQTLTKDALKEALTSALSSFEKSCDSKRSEIAATLEERMLSDGNARATELEKRTEESIKTDADALWRRMEKKLTSMLLRKIEDQFQTTTGNDVLKEALSSALPDFENSCKTMFACLDSKQTKLVQDLEKRVDSMLTAGRYIATELRKHHGNLLELAAKVGAPAGSNSSIALIDRVVDTEQAWIYEQFFSWALLNRDVTKLLWLCSRVDLPRLLAMDPVPLRQTILLSMLDLLLAEIEVDTDQKIHWIKIIRAAVQPSSEVLLDGILSRTIQGSNPNPSHPQT